jgi:hypothetical protein
MFMIMLIQVNYVPACINLSQQMIAANANRATTTATIYLFEFDICQHIIALGYMDIGRSWQAELLAQVAYNGRQNTMQTIVIRATCMLTLTTEKNKTLTKQ